MTFDEARKASRNGAIAAFVWAAFSALVIITATLSNADGFFAVWNDPLNLIDVVIVVLCGVGMLRNSRTAAVCVFAYCIFSFIYVTVVTGMPRGVIVSLVLLYFFGNAIRGTFAYHKLRKQEDPDYRAAPRWVPWVAVPVIVLIGLLTVLGTLSEVGVTPSISVLEASDVPEKDVELLRARNILLPDENIEYLYSWGLVSVIEGGTLLTDKAVVTYFEGENDLVEIYDMPVAEISDIQLVKEGDFFNDSVYRLTSDQTGEWLVIELSVEADGHLKFLDALRAKIGNGVTTSQQ